MTLILHITRHFHQFNENKRLFMLLVSVSSRYWLQYDFFVAGAASGDTPVDHNLIDFDTEWVKTRVQTRVILTRISNKAGGQRSTATCKITSCCVWVSPSGKAIYYTIGNRLWKKPGSAGHVKSSFKDWEQQFVKIP